jgi:prepilin signal peptidase PulO-like enzyme (type II secretory pathway)
MSTALFLPALIASAIALLATPVFAKLGTWGIVQWLERDTAAELRTVRPAWWFAAAGLGLLMAINFYPSPEPSVTVWVLACGLIGLAAALLVQLARIDAHCRLLPDPLTVCLLASGLAFHALVLPTRLLDALIGAFLGFTLLWGLARFFQWRRGIEAMGRGDFAMTAGIGAWLGWQALPMALLFASVFALAFAAVRRLVGNTSTGHPFLKTELPFGPSLSAGAALAWVALG